MGYKRRKKLTSSKRTIKGYTRKDGTKVSAYKRKKINPLFNQRRRTIKR